MFSLAMGVYAFGVYAQMKLMKLDLYISQLLLDFLRRHIGLVPMILMPDQLCEITCDFIPSTLGLKTCFHWP